VIELVFIKGGALGLALMLPERGMPEIALMGPAADVEEADLAALPDLLRRASRVNGMDAQAPSAVLLPTGGMGFFGWPAIAGHRDGRDFTIEFSGWTAERAGTSALLSAVDQVAGLAIAIRAEILDSGALRFATTLTNERDGIYTLDRCMAGSLLLPAEQAEVTTFEGMWGAEMHLKREALGSGLWLKENRRGRTSHDRFPGALFEERRAGVFGSGAWGLHLAWSGNHVIAVDRLDDGRRLTHVGELFEPGEVRLANGESYRSPELVLVYAHEGLDGVAGAFHDYLRGHVLDWPRGAMTPRPVTLNTWEGNYFRHDLQRLKEQADAAAAIGIERFVLDDGWFGRRDDDTTSLGDWIVDRRKYPDGLAPLIDHVRGLGMQFGLWFEPEMVNVESDLHRAHPDWVLEVEGRPLLPSRHQQVLDLTRPEVADHVFARIDSILSEYAIDCIKWDMNRDLTHAAGADGCAVGGRQTRAVHALMARVRAAHPNVEIESCASGGGRMDFGALAHAHRVWTSDCTDALERLEIQRGASVFLPPEIMGAHVSASPNHQTGRRHSIAFRALSALPHHLGVELDPLTLPDEERRELAAFIALHQRLRPLFHAGAAFRADPLDGRHVYGWISEDLRHAAVFVMQAAQQLRELPPPIRIPDLAGDLAYRLSLPAPIRPAFVRSTPAQLAFLDGGLASGALLGAPGLHLPTLPPEHGLLLELTAEPAGA
jgi:alpha-galactosidase